jgi:multidrug efflux system outer membrane protein
MRVSLAVASASLVVVAGCTSGPDYRRPDVTVPTGFTGSMDQARNLANAAWWDLFQDPALEDLITIALGENKDLRIAMARIEEARGALGVTRSEFFPQVAGSASAQRGVRGEAFPGGGEETDYLSAALGLLSYEVDIWGRVRRATESAQAQLLATEEARRAVYIGLVAQVAQTYFELRELDNQIEVARNTVGLRAESYNLTKVKYADGAGIISELDVRQAESSLASARASLASLERQRAQKENQLSVLVGRNPGPLPRGLALQDQKLPEDIPAGLPSTLLERRPDILAAEQQLIAANANIGVARAQYFPRISLTAAFGFESDELDSLFEAGSEAWNVTPQIDAPIFTAGRIRGNVKVAEARREAALATYEQSIQTAFREVEDALVAIRKLREQMAAQETVAQAEHRRLQLVNTRYDQGVSSFLEVLDAQRQLFQAELDLASVRRAHLVAIVQLYKALGGGWQERADKPE